MKSDGQNERKSESTISEYKNEVEKQGRVPFMSACTRVLKFSNDPSAKKYELDHLPNKDTIFQFHFIAHTRSGSALTSQVAAWDCRPTNFLDQIYMNTHRIRRKNANTDNEYASCNKLEQVNDQHCRWVSGFWCMWQWGRNWMSTSPMNISYKKYCRLVPRLVMNKNYCLFHAKHQRYDHRYPYTTDKLAQVFSLWHVYDLIYWQTCYLVKSFLIRESDATMK